MAQTEVWDRKSQRAVPIALIVVAALLLVLRIAESQREPAKEKGGVVDLVQWVPIAQAQRIATQTGRPILYDFTADWCPPCHAMKEEVFANERLAERINRQFVPVRVLDRMREEGKNSPAVQQLQARYNVSAFPTIVITDIRGKQTRRMDGFGGADRFEQMMERVR